ncbi:MAG TPA: sigma-54-dependent Fis family transcriptional regulator [Terriglobia bacterium]|nr:sigma-54-dependent Fis family transcriptional regulator [Terriglobia bacterium]
MQVGVGSSPHTIIDKFLSLLAISRRINSEKDFDALLDLITSEAAKLIEAERATILLLDKARGELWTKTAIGVSETIRFDARLGIAGAVLISGRNMVVEDAYKSPLFYPSVDSATGFLTRNVLCVPLRNVRREIIGAFQVLNKRDSKFTSEDEQLVEALALNAAVALENAKTLTELETRQQELLQENENLRNEIDERFGAKGIVGASQKLSHIRQIIEKVAPSSVPVLITGENGTGKELSARAIHNMSMRKSKPFVAVNCAAIPETLVEAELFGIEKGVATGVERRVGRIESANGGTLFLDEIGDLSLAAQAKLLRVLQEREVEWVGGRKPVPVDVRVLAATNKDLKQEIQRGKFRQDLFFRLNVVHIHLPALRDIRSDIPVLAMTFLRRYAQEAGRELAGFSREAVQALSVYSWPGNIRELENEMRRAVVLANGNHIEAKDFSESVLEEHTPLPTASVPLTSGSKHLLKDRVTALEIQLIRDVMTQTKNDRQRMARALGLSPQGLLNKLKRYGLLKAGREQS